jgi:hypothetical protein
VLLLIFGVRMALADAISDVLTVSDTLGFSMTMQLMESQEPGQVSIVFPVRVLDITNPGGTQLSDILSISSFTVTLSSDGNTSEGPEPPEAALPPIVTMITAVSDQNTSTGISDTLTVTGHPAVSILESAEPLDVIIPIAARSVPFGDGGDSLTISAFTVDLVSLRDQPGADAGSLTDTITINASSDASPIPEPSTLALLGLGLACAVLTKHR